MRSQLRFQRSAQPVGRQMGAVRLSRQSVRERFTARLTGAGQLPLHAASRHLQRTLVELRDYIDMYGDFSYRPICFVVRSANANTASRASSPASARSAISRNFAAENHNMDPYSSPSTLCTCPALNTATSFATWASICCHSLRSPSRIALASAPSSGGYSNSSNNSYDDMTP